LVRKLTKRRPPKVDLDIKTSCEKNFAFYVRCTQTRRHQCVTSLNTIYTDRMFILPACSYPPLLKSSSQVFVIW